MGVCVSPWCIRIIDLPMILNKSSHDYGSIESFLSESKGSRVEQCQTRDLAVLGSSLTQSSVFFMGVLGQDTSEPQPYTGETQKIHEHVSCCRDINEMILKSP